MCLSLVVCVSFCGGLVTPSLFRYIDFVLICFLLFALVVFRFSWGALEDGFVAVMLMVIYLFLFVVGLLGCHIVVIDCVLLWGYCSINSYVMVAIF